MSKSQMNSSPISKSVYKKRLLDLQVELVKLQRHFIAGNDKILILFEGRDAAGKDGVIKRIVQHLSPRETRVVALGKPSDREQSSWYFQRYVPHLPAAGEMVLFNRSWYNRAGVERVMGFCSLPEYEEFMGSVVEFEDMLVRSGVKMMKYYLDISRQEQEKRLQARKSDPLKQWKISPIDAKAMEFWQDYSLARDEMLARTHTVAAPWTIVHADDKRQARLNVISDILTRLRYDGKDQTLVQPDTRVVLAYDRENFDNNRLAS
ncbi:polyphosphate kinase 2 [Pseudohongiella sp.]|uniref:Polyphosphate kinase-2-related domain-containing protein n=1 Tax=marine sediment metagenome TaxID=412755 RepID=A0A0F9VY41_9ZZZZ|nr:polyphosphate kinase 2 [Pseudohongiella sp.]HDZ08014.1 polyphosphate kinase 2 [Pseudohongiella sp.]HEA64143.1 polyphosphate kinase 2 [Pseudohongiella sp.]